jgi:hypothetical protein
VKFVSFVRTLIIKKLIKLTTSEKRHMKEVPFLIADEGLRSHRHT